MSVEDALTRLAEHLRDDPVIAPHVRDPVVAPALGELTALGPRASAAPEEYAFLVEAIREGYLLHYAEPRLLDGAERDLGLLAGDYLYALGLERLASRGDLEAVQELADLISLSAQLHSSGDGGAAEALWLAATVAVAVGPDGAHERGKALLRAGDSGSGVEELLRFAFERGEREGLEYALGPAAEQVGFAARNPERG